MQTLANLKQLSTELHARLSDIVRHRETYLGRIRRLEVCAFVGNDANENRNAISLSWCLQSEVTAFDCGAPNPTELVEISLGDGD